MDIKRKIIPTILVVAGMVAVISVWGGVWIQKSEPYAMAVQHVAAQKPRHALETKFKFAWWRSWSFSDGVNGHAKFVLCEEVVCYRVIASRHEGVWKIETVSQL